MAVCIRVIAEVGIKCPPNVDDLFCFVAIYFYDPYSKINPNFSSYTRYFTLWLSATWRAKRDIIKQYGSTV